MIHLIKIMRLIIIYQKRNNNNLHKFNKYILKKHQILEYLIKMKKHKIIFHNINNNK